MIVSITVRNAKKNSTPLDIFTTFLLSLIYRFSQAEKRSSHFFFPHVSRAQRLVLARTRAQCTDHWITGRGLGVPSVQLTTHVKSSTLNGRSVVLSYSRTSKFFRPDGLLLFCIIMGLRSASAATTLEETLHM